MVSRSKEEGMVMVKGEPGRQGTAQLGAQL